MLCVFICGVVMWVHTYVIIHQVAHFRSTHITACVLHLNFFDYLMHVDMPKMKG